MRENDNVRRTKSAYPGWLYPSGEIYSCERGDVVLTEAINHPQAIVFEVSILHYLKQRKTYQ
jgi:hypothetical protein